ncbi:MAG: hypothetical protein PF518_14105 [Spirochaetaceae bacterium]|jgi:ssDNA-binding Zn-finger/Zn-ribbon topoisomerase 1|nr:hypothetical protein [Spirochaetaceae bacterium]
MAKSFHCDNCGEAVSPDEERCPNCGRFFRAVRCPVCSYTGPGADFLKGCPSCGYLKDQAKKKKEIFSISRFFAYTSIFFLLSLLIYLIYLFSKI